MSKTILLATRSRLNETPKGRALLALVERFHSPMHLAEAMGVNPQLVRQWLYNGQISLGGAKIAERTLQVAKESLRPDVTPESWAEQKKVVERKPEKDPVAKTEDARLLVKLAAKMGSVRAVCDAAGCTTGDYHTWKCRGRIPAIKLPTFLGLKQ